MDLFHIIDDGVAILRLKGGIEKQVRVYRRGEKLYVPAKGGYLRLTRGSGTLDPNITCLALEGPGIKIINNMPTYVEPSKPVALEEVRKAS